MSNTKNFMRLKDVLCKQYKKNLSLSSRHTALERLLVGIIGGDVNSAAAKKVLNKFKEEFVDYNELRVSRARELMRCLEGIDSPLRTGNRILAALAKVFKDYHTVDLSKLSEKSPEEARKYLLSIDGVDERITSELLLTEFSGEVFPVTPEIMRVVKRLGLIKTQTNRIQVQKKLQETVPAKEVRSLFYGLEEHAKKVCLEDAPLCQECILGKQCVSKAEFLAVANLKKIAAVAKSHATAKKSKSEKQITEPKIKIISKDEKKTPSKKTIKKSAAKKPVVKKPAAKKPVVKKPVAKKPAAKKPVAKKPAAKKPVAKKPAAKKPVSRKKSRK